MRATDSQLNLETYLTDTSLAEFWSSYIRTTLFPGYKRYIIVRGDSCTDRASLFAEFAAALQFPLYFGDNWSAFEDCITDLGWWKSLYPLCVVLTFPEAILAEHPDDRRILSEIFADNFSTAGNVKFAAVQFNPGL